MPRLPRPEDIERLAVRPGRSALGGSLRATRDRLLRAVLRQTAPPIDGGPADGGRGPHPLGDADLPEFDPGPLAGLGQAALLAGRGRAEGLDGAIAWIAGDRPGEGADWASPGEVACRLIHLAAVYAWTRPDGGQAAAMGGSARAHAAWLIRERPIDDADPDATLALAALLVASRTWPALPDARRWTGQALAGLRTAAPAMVGEDGGPAAGSPNAVARALWSLALARAWEQAQGGALPVDAVGALLQGGNALWRIQGDGHALPIADDRPAGLLPLGPVGLVDTLRDLLLAWELDDGPRAGTTADPAVLRLAGRLRGDAPEPFAPDSDWQLWSWRGSGVAVAHAFVKGTHARVFFQQHGGRLEWDLDGKRLVAGTRPPARLSVARRDGSKARIIAVPPGEDTFADARPQRDIVARNARLLVTDTGVDRVAWTLGEGWALTRDAKGAWVGQQGERSLVVKLDDEGWDWTVRGSRIEGRGDPRTPVRSIFEVR